jgi:hypothetical protein
MSLNEIGRIVWAVSFAEGQEVIAKFIGDSEYVYFNCCSVIGYTVSDFRNLGTSMIIWIFGLRDVKEHGVRM